MTKQEMIDVIYDKIADKTLSFGCRIVMESKIKNKFPTGVIVQNIFGWIATLPSGGRITKKEGLIGFKERFKIIGHSVMIGDVLDYIEKTYPKNGIYIGEKNAYGLKSEIVHRNYRKEKRKPIEDQSYECIKYIYNLII